ncbi:exonuclease RecJ [Hasllibacter halocynthiae]|uniref:Single-stranded-DNA-specific exonuclease RecJ n=1 Tax=Hasllibacter halocynthiae TaxID=595589 RepID=A0A2T0X7A5_9RHOB|nr:single-stranded-DNA-specific exonuclease RecJ [Hasllibacter halocynthiae]PRY94830.1 exonuclease RecJ [Hasllibacter halocynthiae]
MPRDHDAAFLHVESSLSGRRWTGPSADALRLGEALAQATGLPAALAGVLARQGVRAETAAAYLAPKLKDLLPDPRGLRDMERAATRLDAAAERGERIAIFADYDVDGGASAALLIWWLRALGRDATLYVPDRLREGYGPNPEAMAQLSASHDLIVCVDCGTAAHEALEAAGGTDVIVLDHHLGTETPPPVLACVNPNRPDEDGALGHLCAAAVTFLCLVEANRQRRGAGREAPDLMGMTDLVALATVADVAPLMGVNRAFVQAGLRAMGRGGRPGLEALAATARLSGPPTPYHLGFVLGPRINAAGRVGRADLGARLLASADRHEAAALADRLEEVNAERKAVEGATRVAALAQAEARLDADPDAPLVWAAGEGWHPGVLGITAGQLARRFRRPAVVLGVADGMAKGSGRSVAGVDLGSCVARMARAGELASGGGHVMAAGLSVGAGCVEAAMARLGELLARQGAGGGEPSDLALDSMLMPGACDMALARQLEAAGPWGEGASAPRFAVPEVRIHDARPVGQDGLRLTVSDGIGPRLQVIAFGAMSGPIGPRLLSHGGGRFHLAGRLEVNRWQGRESVQLALIDAAEA